MGKQSKPTSRLPANSKAQAAKASDLERDLETGAGEFLTSNQGVRINDNHNSLKAGERGPSLLEDFLLREKITHFDHERIPERVVHARGSGAHGYFELNKSLAKYTRAEFLQEPNSRTPVFVRFSTVAGSRGSSDLARDVRGFAIKFYTSAGNFDLVGNNMPVFFIQDAIKFPDLVHAVKPEPHNEIPQAASAHDTFWDFISHTPESAPVTPIGSLVLDRNPENFFAEVEQVAFHVGHVVPGIDFTNDPLLQGRLFSYTDTQLIRLGGPNFHEIPINRPIAPLHNNTRDGFMRQMINRGKTAYDPSSLSDGDPHQAKVADGGFESFAERIEASKIRARSQSFTDHFSQAAMFFHSQAEIEQRHIVNALRFELGKCETKAVRERVLFLLSQFDDGLAKDVAASLGIKVPKKIDGPLNANVGADADPKPLQPKKFAGDFVDSAPLSIIRSAKRGMNTAKIAMLLADGFAETEVDAVKQALIKAGGNSKIIALHGGTVTGDNGTEIVVDFSLPTVASLLFDAVYVVGGALSIKRLNAEPRAIDFVEV